MENSAQYSSILYWIALILPSLIAGTVSIVSLITNHRSSKVGQAKNMVFAQKEKVADQFIEKSSELIAITDPLVLNAKINEYTPTIITHDEFMRIMQELLSVDNRVQTLSTVIKLHTWSIYEENRLKDVDEMFSSIDVVQKHIQDMIMELIKLHSSNTEQGRFMKPNPMEEKQDLERHFSEAYREPYCAMVVAITQMAKLLRREALDTKKK